MDIFTWITDYPKELIYVDLLGIYYFLVLNRPTEKIVKNLQGSYDYAGNSCHDSNSLKCSDLFFQKDNGHCYGNYR